MIAENITLYGGPRHGQEMAIPGDRDDLEIVVGVTNDRVRGNRKGHYTRVHNAGGQPTHDFEWAGYTSPFVPMEA